MPEIVWRGDDFSMRPVDPATAGDNPVTRVLNMVLKGNREVRKRQDFQGDVISTMDNAIVGHIGQADRLVIKAGTSITPYLASTSTGGLLSGTSLNNPSSDVPIGSVNDFARGSFTIANGELYYADDLTIFAWDGNTPGKKRRPGVPSLDDLDYVDMKLAKSPNDTGTYAGYGPPFGSPENHPFSFLAPPATPGDEIFTTKWSPRIIFSDALAAVGGNPREVGSKLLNTSFAFSWYDPQRRIFGTRSKPFALPYLFAGGPKAPIDIDDILSSARTQYAKIVATPDSRTIVLAGTPHAGRTLGNDRLDLQVAIWFSRGFLPAANTSEVINGGWWAVAVWTPAMSVGMNALMFLEKIEDQRLDEVNCGKDDATLYASGRYIDQYARPVPCRFMTILPNGTGLYFYPRTPINRRVETGMDDTDPPVFLGDQSQTSRTGGIDPRNTVEYSVGHPESIGRNTNELRDTVSPIPFLSGEIIAAIPSGAAPILLTTQGLHRVGFQRDVIITEISNTKGIVSKKSYQHSAAGDFWFSHEGVIWRRGDEMIVLDEQLGFSDWFDDMPYAKRKDVAIGVAESESQVIITLPGEANRVLCYDYAKKFASEFSDEADFTHAIYFKGFLRTSKGNYPGPLVVTEPTEVTAWISEDVNRSKQLKWVELKLGKGEGTVTVTVTAFDHPDARPEYASTALTRTASITLDMNSGQRVRLQDFIGMRGRMFEIKIEGALDSTNWGIQELRCEYDSDEMADARSI